MLESLQTLATIYQADRADRSSTVAVSLATMAAAVTYVVGTIAFYDKLDALGWGIALLPIPLLSIAAFHSLLVDLAAARAKSILTIERLLINALPEGLNFDRAAIGVTATEPRANVHTAPAAQRAAILIAYGGVGASYLGYVAVMLWRAAGHLAGWVAVPAAVYLVLLVLIGRSWFLSTGSLDFRLEGSSERP